MRKILLKLKNVKGGYKANQRVLRGIDLSIGENESVAVVGQNGSGKSTLAKAIFNMLPNRSGEIWFDDELLNEIPTEKIGNYGISFFMQGGLVFPHLTVHENLEFAGDGLPKSVFEKRQDELSHYFYLLEERNRWQKMAASHLSGGEKQQLAMAMVLVKKPSLLVLDEPSAGLSPGNVTRLYELLTSIRRREKTSILLIEQNVQFAFEFCDRTALLRMGIIENPDMSLGEIEDNYFGKLARVVKEKGIQNENHF